MSNKEETKEETKEQEKTSSPKIIPSLLTSNDLESIGTYTPPQSKQELYGWLQAAMSIELATLPLYCQAWFSMIPGNNDKAKAASSVMRSIIIEEMLHMNIVSNLMLTIFEDLKTNPVKCAFTIDYASGSLPQRIRPDLFNGPIKLDRYAEDQLLLFAQLECETTLAPFSGNPFKPSPNELTKDVEFAKTPRFNTIGEFYTALIQGLQNLSPSPFGNGSITYGANTDKQGIRFYTPPHFPVDLDSHTPIQSFSDAEQLLIGVIDQGEGVNVVSWAKKKKTWQSGDEKPHFIKFVELCVGSEISSVGPSSNSPSSTEYFRLTFTYASGGAYTFTDCVQPASNFITPGNVAGDPPTNFTDIYTNMLNTLESNLNGGSGEDPVDPTGMSKLQGAFTNLMNVQKYPKWLTPSLPLPPSVFVLVRKARVLFLKKKLKHTFYQQNIQIKNAATKGVNGIYKNTRYSLLPSTVRKQDVNAKRDQGIIGYQHIFSGSGTEYYITVSTNKTKDVKSSSPTLSIYELNIKDSKVILLYTVSSKYGVLPDPKKFTYNSNEKGDKKSNPRVLLHINDFIEPSKLVDAFSGVWYGDKGIDTMFIRDQGDPINGPLGGNINKGYATSYNETVEYVPLSFGVLNPRTLSTANPAGDPDTAEVIYGVRLVRRVLSTLPDNDKTKDNPFKSGGTIHEETGYILFMYEGSILKRVVKSLAVPRGITVLASDETPTVVKEGDIIKINVELESKSNPEENDPWIIGNGEFVTKNGKISSFIQEISLVFNMKTPSESTFTYTQNTPITLKDKELDHFNENMLRKQA